MNGSTNMVDRTKLAEEIVPVRLQKRTPCLRKIRELSVDYYANPPFSHHRG